MENQIVLEPGRVVKFEALGSSVNVRKKPIHRVSLPRGKREPGKTVVYIAMETLTPGDTVYIVKTEVTNQYVKYFCRRLIHITENIQEGGRIK